MMFWQPLTAFIVMISLCR